MLTQTPRIPLPNADPRWDKVNQQLLRYGYGQQALIEVLRALQGAFGYLDPAALRYIAAALNVRPSIVYGVATFYHLFSLTPPAEHCCVVCTGTACHLRGADEILKVLKESTGLTPGDKSADGEVEIQTARCVGFCTPAPVVIFDDEPTGNATSTSVVRQVRRWINHAT